MGNMGPVYLAWSHILHRPIALALLLTELAFCQMLLYVAVGMASMPAENGTVTSPPGSHTDDGKERGEPLPPVARMLLFAVAFATGLLLLMSIGSRNADRRFHEFALLHAMGYPWTYVHGVVLAEIGISVAMAFVPVTVLMYGLEGFVRVEIGWSLEMSWMRVGVVLLEALAFSAMGSFIIFSRRLGAVDPANLF